VLGSVAEFVSPWGVLLIIFAVVAVVCVVWFAVRHFRKPKDKEKRRRMEINQRGRLGDATVTEVDAGIIFYEYSVGGVGYVATQDVSQLHEHIPADTHRLIGPATFKYFPENPANSIVLCEEWSGLRMTLLSNNRSKTPPKPE